MIFVGSPDGQPSMSDCAGPRARRLQAFRIPTERRAHCTRARAGPLRPRRFERLQVLDDVSFVIDQGETVGIMGRNGCGKSTLLKIICEIFAPDRGRGRHRAADADLRIRGRLESGTRCHRQCAAHRIGDGAAPAEIRKRMDEILDFSDCRAFANLKLKHYSTGMAARLAYAVAFAAVRDVLVLDEIFAVGDAGLDGKV